MTRSPRTLKGLPLDSIKRDTPIRLETAAAIAFADGGMTAAGLRTEARKGHLRIAKMAGKDFTTLAAIEEMVRLCTITTAASPSRISTARISQTSDDSALTRARASVDRLCRSK